MLFSYSSDRKPLPEKTKKEMLRVEWESIDNAPLPDPTCFDRSQFLNYPRRPVVFINYSSLELIQTCKRKAYFSLERNLTANEESQATLFGGAIHKALEAWYLAPRNHRLHCSREGVGQEDEAHSSTCANCRAKRVFLDSCQALTNLDLNDKRHPYNGLRILSKYFDQYHDDPFEILCDEKGPIVERRIEFTLIDEPALKVIFFGTIDCILKNIETGVTLVCDHKTTSTLGSEFYNRLKPNFQYTGYVLGAQRCLGVDTNLFLVNGLQVAKTKADLARQVTQRDEDDFKELVDAVRWAVNDYLQCRETQVWPQNAPNPCTMYGGCQYRSICEVPKSIRENVISSMFKGDMK